MSPIHPSFPSQFETERLLVRAPRVGDGRAIFEGIAESLAELRAWPASLAWAISEPTVAASEAFSQQSQADFAARLDLPMLLFLKDGMTYIGGSGLHNLDWFASTCEIGYWVRTSCHGRGLASEAVRAISEFALRTIKIRRIVCLPEVENQASRRVVERAGYTFEGLFHNERSATNGQMRSKCLYALEGSGGGMPVPGGGVSSS